jgi:UDP-2,4-diacetamido-2,4,6-trideoxy-beta-L-altropyranose hydrolase
MSAGAPVRRVAFRVDSSSEIGSGHLRRCLALAAQLREQGADIAFVCRAHPGNFNQEVVTAGHALRELPLSTSGNRAASASPYANWLGTSAGADASETSASLGPHGEFEAIVVDHYAIDAAWERQMRAAVRRIVVVDDLADRPHDCDVLVDSAPGPDKAARYARLSPAGVQLLIGPRYALLRQEFARQPGASENPVGELRRAVVSFGGVDALGYSLRAVEALRTGIGAAAVIDVIIGVGSPQLPRLRDMAVRDAALNIHVDARNIAELMRQADLAVISAGVTAWECAAVGLPAIATPIVPNQSEVARALEDIPCALTASVTQFDSDVARCAGVLSGQRGLRAAFARNARATVDGRGASRVARAVLPPQITLRRATPADSRSIWEWRNDPLVRRHSRSSDAIPWVAHEEWLARTLADSTRALLVASSHGQPVAVVRFDAQGATAEISIYLTPGHHGRGLGPHVLTAAERWLGEHVPEVREIRAYVRSENEASSAAFTQAGYMREGLHFSRHLKALHGAQ